MYLSSLIHFFWRVTQKKFDGTNIFWRDLSIVGYTTKLIAPTAGILDKIPLGSATHLA